MMLLFLGDTAMKRHLYVSLIIRTDQAAAQGHSSQEALRLPENGSMDWAEDICGEPSEPEIVKKVDGVFEGRNRLKIQLGTDLVAQGHLVDGCKNAHPVTQIEVGTQIT